MKTPRSNPFQFVNWTNPDPLCHECGKQFCDHKGNVPELTRELTAPDYRKPADPAEWEKVRQYLMNLVDAARLGRGWDWWNREARR